MKASRAIAGGLAGIVASLSLMNHAQADAETGAILDVSSPQSVIHEPCHFPDKGYVAWKEYLTGQGIKDHLDERIARYADLGYASPLVFDSSRYDGKDIAVVAIALHDHNGALQTPAVKFNLEYLGRFYTVVPLIINDENELFKYELPGTQEQRTLFMLCSHPIFTDNDPGLDIGYATKDETEDYKITGQDQKDIKGFVRQFASDADIVLDGCRTAQDIAPYWKEAAGERKVWSSKEDFAQGNLILGVYLDGNEPVFSMKILKGDVDVAQVQ